MPRAGSGKGIRPLSANFYGYERASGKRGIINTPSKETAEQLLKPVPEHTRILFRADTLEEAKEVLYDDWDSHL